jgi:hypothetical protein
MRRTQVEVRFRWVQTSKLEQKLICRSARAGFVRFCNAGDANVQEGYDGSTGPSTANARQYSSYRMAMIRPYETLRYCQSLMWFEAPAAGTCASYANTLSSSDRLRAGVEAANLIVA